MSTEGVSSSSSAEEAYSAGETQAVNKKPEGDASGYVSTKKGGGLAHFKAKYPELYDKWMMQMATQMTNKAKRDNDRLIKLMKESRRR
jgi:hypothetical protein